MLKSTTSGRSFRTASRSSRRRRNHGRASSGVAPAGGIVIRPRRRRPSRSADARGECAHILGRHAGPFAREVDLDHGVEHAAGVGGTPGEALGRPVARKRLDHVGERGDVMGGVRLQRADVVPARPRHDAVHRSQLAHVVVTDRRDTGLDHPAHGFGRLRLRRRDERDGRRVAPRTVAGPLDARAHRGEVRHDLVPADRHACIVPRRREDRRRERERGRGGLSAKRRGKGASSRVNLPAPTPRGPRGARLQLDQFFRKSGMSRSSSASNETTG